MKTSFGAMTGRERLCFVLKYLFMALCVVVALFPIIWVILSSFKTNAEILSNGISLPTHFGFDGYKSALDMAPIFKFFGNGVIVTCCATVLNVLVFAMAGYAFARFRFPCDKLLYMLLSLSLVIPMTALLQPVYSVVNNLGLYDTEAGLILVNTALNMPMSLLILRGSFQSIPKAIEEAAYIDGAGYGKTMIQIIFPMAQPSIVTIILFNFLSFWNEYIISMTLMSSANGAKTLPVGLLNLMQAQQSAAQYGIMYAGLVMVMLPTLILYICVQKKLIQGMTVGGLKG